MARTARAMQANALNAAALLQQQADLARPPRCWIIRLKSSGGGPLLTGPSR
jgi:hypothetical protein